MYRYLRGFNALILKAMYPDAVISVDAGCCAGVTPEKHKALETMKSCQIDVWASRSNVKKEIIHLKLINKSIVKFTIDLLRIYTYNH